MVDENSLEIEEAALGEAYIKGREFNNTNWISCINPDL